MSKPMVEKYEQMLAQDPTSTVFVELARAYLDRGDNERAIQACQQGVTHHPNSVVGRVLWGKALINAGKAADAMKQFDLAVNIDRDNPHAYNLIGEALLRKGLFRSALPILRKAAALQPNDGRIAQWLDQTKQALAGGPAPVLYDTTSVDTQALTASGAPAPASAPEAAALGGEALPPTDAFAAFGAGKSDPDAQPTVLMNAYTAGAPPVGGELDRGLPPVPTGEMPAVDDGPVIEGEVVTEGRSTQEMPGAGPGEAPDPFAAVMSSAQEPDTFRGLTSTFDALAEGASPEVPHVPPPEPSSPRNTEPSVVVAVPEFEAPPPPPPEGGLLDEIVSQQSELPTSEFQLPGMRQRAAPAQGSGGLLDEIPDESLEPASAPAVPKVEFNTQATEAIAKEYERELRAKLEVVKQKKTFWQQHGLKIAAIAVLVVVAGGLGGSFLYTRVQNKGETLDTAVAKGLSSVNADTKEQYGAAIKALEQALKMDVGNAEALALKGYAHAMLFAEHGAGPAEREAALEAFSGAKVREARPELALIVDYLTADEGSRAAARQQLLGSDLEKSVVHAQAGRLLLTDKKFDDALGRLKKATEFDPRNTRALVALGDYYLAFEDWDSALEMLSRAEALSKFHPARVVGHAEARLELGRELPEALSDLEGLPTNASVPPALQGRYTLMLGRALSAAGRHDDALRTLTEGQPLYTQYTFEYAMALGHARRAAGEMAAAQKAFEDAMSAAPKSEAAREGFGRVLLARSREKELLERLKPEKDQRKVALVRGIAQFRLGDTKKARQELAGTQVSGKYPAEAAIYLALSDAAEDGASNKAVEALEKLAGSLRKNKATVQVALARVYMQKGALDKARAQLEEAAKDPHDYEGNALLGELLLKAGVPTEVAIEPLQRAVERNGSHGPSRHLYTRLVLSQGKVAEAVKQVEAWTADNPALEQAWADAALVYLQAGKLQEAEAAIAKVPISSSDVETHRTRAAISFARADGAKAMESLQRANKLNPKDGETFCEVAFAFIRQGNTDVLDQVWQTALKQDPQLICALAGPYHARPVAKGKPAPKDILAQLAARSPHAWEKAFVQATLARVLLLDGDLSGARSAADEALALAPHHPAAWFASGEVFKKEKDDEKALEAYGKAAALDGAWSLARLAYAEALAKKGGASLPQAIAQYEAVLLIDQNEADLSRVKKLLPTLKKQLSP